MERENDGGLSFLDIKIFREKGKFVINVILCISVNIICHIGRRPSVVFILISTPSYPKPLKPV